MEFLAEYPYNLLMKNETNRCVVDKITIRFTPKAEDYSRVLRDYSAAIQTSVWILRGFFMVVFVVFLLQMISSIFDGDLKMIAFNFPILLVLLFLFMVPTLPMWFSVRKISKQPQLLQPVTYEFDDEKIYVLNQLSESKSDWSVYNKAFETDQYYVLVYTTNKNMFQFFPKRAFESSAQEGVIRSLIEKKMGKINNLQKGFRGWKLSLLVAILVILGIILCGLTFFVASFFLG